MRYIRAYRRSAPGDAATVISESSPVFPEACAEEDVVYVKWVPCRVIWDSRGDISSSEWCCAGWTSDGTVILVGIRQCNQDNRAAALSMCSEFPRHVSRWHHNVLDIVFDVVKPTRPSDVACSYTIDISLN